MEPGISLLSQLRFPRVGAIRLNISARQAVHLIDPRKALLLDPSWRCGCRLWVISRPPECVSATAAVPQIADDLLQRASRQPWAKCGLMHRSINTRLRAFGHTN
jgi:hypothetical protein